MDKFKNKYRIQSHRKPSWDYSADALYFLTIITQNRECNLGEIKTVETHGSVETHGRASLQNRVSLQQEMILSDFGKIVEIEWFKSFEIRDELVLHEFILMPNHLHAIVEIDNKNRDTTRRDARPCVSTFEPSEISEPSPQNNNVLQIKRNPPIRLPKSISSFMAGFKSAVNTQIDDYIDEQRRDARPCVSTKYNRNNHFFQPNYHDHIIRNNFEYKNIQTYIENNPMNWEKDTFYV